MACVSSIGASCLSAQLAGSVGPVSCCLEDDILVREALFSYRDTLLISLSGGITRTFFLQNPYLRHWVRGSSVNHCSLGDLKKK